MSGENQPVGQLGKRNSRVSGRSWQQAVRGKSWHGVPFQKHGSLGTQNEVGSTQVASIKGVRHGQRCISKLNLCLFGDLWSHGKSGVVSYVLCFVVIEPFRGDDFNDWQDFS